MCARPVPCPARTAVPVGRARCRGLGHSPRLCGAHPPASGLGAAQGGDRGVWVPLALLGAPRAVLGEGGPCQGGEFLHPTSLCVCVCVCGVGGHHCPSASQRIPAHPSVPQRIPAQPCTPPGQAARRCGVAF